MKDQSQENIDRVKSFYRAVQSRDFTAAGNLLDANVEWIEPKAEGLWFGGTNQNRRKKLEKRLGLTFFELGARIGIFFDAMLGATVVAPRAHFD